MASLSTSLLSWNLNVQWVGNITLNGLIIKDSFFVAPVIMIIRRAFADQMIPGWLQRYFWILLKM